MSDFSPDDRVLFEERATALYEEAVNEGGLKDDDPRIRRRGEDRPAFDLLVSLGLLIHDAQDKLHIPVDPSAVQSRVVAPMSQQGANLLAESSAWATTFGTLAHAWRRSPAASRGPFTELQGSAIAEFIQSVVDDAQSELLTAQPQATRNIQLLEGTTRAEIEVLERGVKLRNLYQHSARRSAATHKYVAAVTAHGAEIRTLDEFFNRLIVVDRRIAIIPGKTGGALAVREPMIVDYLVDVFERHWQRARPYASRETTMMREVAAEQRAMTIRMLIEGHADPASAKRVGVSPRTYATYVADLKSEYEAETRFQLGYTMGRLGISGREDSGGESGG